MLPQKNKSVYNTDKKITKNQQICVDDEDSSSQEVEFTVEDAKK